MTHKAMKLALEALELAHPRFGIATEKHKQAITAIEEALAQEQEPWCMKMNGCKTKCEDCPVEVAQQEPVAMKFKIYKPTVPDPLRQGINNALLPWVYDQDRSSGFDATMWVTPVATLPPQRTWEQPEERNFCSRCGKRTADLTVIHTCTPPQENT